MTTGKSESDLTSLDTKISPNKFCKDCKHSRKSAAYHSNAPEAYWCHRQFFPITFYISPVLGRVDTTKTADLCMIERSTPYKYAPDRCGLEGKYWEPKE
jgi:hypothetical protein